jgi:hypothetical protein
MLQNEATVLKQMTDVLSHLLVANCSVSSITYRDDSCATRVVGDNRHWIGKQNEPTNKTHNTMSSTTSDDQHTATAVTVAPQGDVMNHDDMHYNVHAALKGVSFIPGC